MKRNLAFLLLIVAAPFSVQAQVKTTKTVQNANIEKEIIELERQWASAIQKQDEVQVSRFLSDDYFLAVGVQGASLQIFPRKVWLETLKVYKTESFNIDDIKVHDYDGTAVVIMLFSQRATVRGQDRSAQFVITDVWIKRKDGWRVAERHSSRPEPQGLLRLQ